MRAASVGRSGVSAVLKRVEPSKGGIGIAGADHVTGTFLAERRDRLMPKSQNRPSQTAAHIGRAH
jgi:hypothetical protein